MSEFVELCPLPPRSTQSLRSLTRPQSLKSSNVRRLQDCLDLVFSAREKAVIVELLRDFHTDHDVDVLVDNLAPMLDSTVKQHFVALLHRVLPPRHAGKFESACERRGLRLSFDQETERRRETEDVGEERREEMDVQSTSVSAPRVVSLPLPRRAVKSELLRHFGFVLRSASRDQMVALYITEVKAGSVAELHGLRAGDRLLRIDTDRCEGWNEERAVEALWSARKRSRVSLELQFEGRLPHDCVSKFSFSWTDVHGRPCSPPAGFETAQEKDSPKHRSRRSAARHLSDTTDRKIHLRVSRSKPLGISIRGGQEFDLGVFITGVEPFSPAEAAGLRPGDQIVDVNGHDFLDISIRDATRVLKSSSHLVFTLRSVGKLPHTRTMLDRTTWRRVGVSAPSLHRGPGSQLTWSSVTLPGPRLRPTIPALDTRVRPTIPALDTRVRPAIPDRDAEIRLRRVAANSLTESQLLTLDYYLREYRSGHVTVDELVLALRQLLVEERNRCLLPLVRDACVREAEKDAFDALLLTAEMEATSNDSAVNQTNLSDSDTPDSEIGPHTARVLEQALQALDSIDVADDCPPLSSQDSGFVAVDEQKEEEEEEETPVEEPSSQHSTVILHKSHPTLGLAIEGGADTKQPLPRIINVQVNPPPTEHHLVRLSTPGSCEKAQRVRRIGLSVVGGAEVSGIPLPKIVEVEVGGSAHESGKLHVGQTIVEVNGQSLAGLSHRDAARLIAEAFRRTDQSSMELTVTS